MGCKILFPQRLSDPTLWVKIQVLDPTSTEKHTQTHTHKLTHLAFCFLAVSKWGRMVCRDYMNECEKWSIVWEDGVLLKQTFSRFAVWYPWEEVLSLLQGREMGGRHGATEWATWLRVGVTRGQKIKKISDEVTGDNKLFKCSPEKRHKIMKKMSFFITISCCLNGFTRNWQIIQARTQVQKSRDRKTAKGSFTN